MAHHSFHFRFKPEKFVEAVVYLLSLLGPSTRMTIVKLLYFADRYHLLRHGTPILGDRYYRLPWGPVPSRALDLLEAAADIEAGAQDAARDEVSDLLLRLLEIRRPDTRYPEYKMKRRLEVQQLEQLSRSEVEALNVIVERYGRLTARELSNVSHSHAAWAKTEPSQEIDYRLFFADEPDANPEALRYLMFSQEDRELIDKLRS